jgi:hypothetical protein
MAKKISAAKARPAAPAKAPAKPKLAATIDYPQEGEAVRSGHYSVRVTAAGATQAQVRVGDEEWADCREAVGHFWREWSPSPGRVTLAARARTGKGRWCAAAAREVVVS